MKVYTLSKFKESMMFAFVKAMIATNDAKKEYKEALTGYLNDGILDETEQQNLQELKKSLNLSDDDIKQAHRKATNMLYSEITSDKKVTVDERKALEALINYFGMSTNDFNFDQKTFNEFYTLGLIEGGTLPIIQNHDINVVFKKDEVLHWGCGAMLAKHKRITTRVNYGGLTTSVRIMKGVHYRAGSMRVAAESKEVIVPDDVGALWITNQRIGFRGQRKNFAFPLSKIAYFELTGSGLLLAKEGKETPYLIRVDNYDVPAAVLSHLLNS
jgi:hypothetical protein